MSESTNAYDPRRRENSTTSTGLELRWWPAAVLLIAMVAIRLVVRQLDSPGLPILMVGFMGPGVLGLLVLGWWCFASRAGGKEKIIGLVGLLVIAAIAISLIHFSLNGMGVVLHVIPTGMALFAIGLILFSRKAHLRLPIALLLSGLGFGYWDLRQSEGVTGDFSSQLKWRWEPTAEEEYLRELASRAPTANAAEEPSPTSSAASSLDPSPWPAFRGAERNGTVTGITLAEDWQAIPPKEIWRIKLGPAWSSFSVGGERLYTQEQRGEQEAVICLDANTGALLWDFSYPGRFWEAVAGAGPRATPTIDGGRLFALGARGTLVCLDATTGREVWRRELTADAKREPPQWGFAASPLVTDGRVIVHAGGKDNLGLFAYDAGSGDIVWSIPAGDHSYSSAQLATFDATRGILMLTNGGLQFVDIADGAIIWEHAWQVDNYRCLQPLVMDHSILMATSLGLGTRRITVALNSEGKWDVKEDWTSLDMKPDYNDYVAYHDAVYGFDGSIFACIDAATGKRLWKRGRYGNGQVLLLSDAGQLLVSSEKGELVLLRATPEKLDELAKFSAIDGKTWNHPVLVGSRLYLRNAEQAACFELPLSATP